MTCAGLVSQNNIW